MGCNLTERGLLSRKGHGDNHDAASLRSVRVGEAGQTETELGCGLACALCGPRSNDHFASGPGQPPSDGRAELARSADYGDACVRHRWGPPTTPPSRWIR